MATNTPIAPPAQKSTAPAPKAPEPAAKPPAAKPGIDAKAKPGIDAKAKSGVDAKKDNPNQKQTAPHDANARKDLPTPDHVASKENRAAKPNDDTMADLPGTFQTAAPSGPARSRVDKDTLSDQPANRPSKP